MRMADHQAYPTSVGFDGIYTNWGEAKQDWIPCLAPNYLYTLPRDTSNTDQADKQYLYRSDGQDYKLRGIVLFGLFINNDALHHALNPISINCKAASNL
ncbi:hypothetical protein BGP_3145 [Beggiatoa sp. PS]|nr:hypothetical protein BGP_3145 [Beggiatoa sp. PS]